MKWAHEKDWKNGIHLGVNLNGRRHKKYKEWKANAAGEETHKTTSETKEKDSGVATSANFNVRM